MKTLSSPFNRAGKNLLPGFTILELLIVILIMTVLMVGAVPALSNLLRSSNLTRGGQIMIDQLSLARQIASVKNRPVEVRLVQLDGGYNAVQLWSMNDGGTNVAAQRIARLPSDIYIATSGTLSPQLSTLPGSTMTVNGVSGINYKSFSIRPSGSVEPVPDLTNRPKLYYTFVNSRHTNNTTPPDNYVTLQINPDTGIPILFRP